MHADLVGRGQRPAESRRQRLRSRVEVRLKDGDQAPVRELAKGSQRGRHLGRVMGVVVVDHRSRPRPLALEATGHAREARQRGGELPDRRQRRIELPGAEQGTDRRGRIGDVVAARHREADVDLADRGRTDPEAIAALDWAQVARQQRCGHPGPGRPVEGRPRSRGWSRRRRGPRGGAPPAVRRRRPEPRSGRTHRSVRPRRSNANGGRARRWSRPRPRGRARGSCHRSRRPRRPPTAIPPSGRWRAPRRGRPRAARPPAGRRDPRRSPAARERSSPRSSSCREHRRPRSGACARRPRRGARRDA